MARHMKQKYIDNLFIISLAIKAFDSVIEIVASLGILLLSHSTLTHIAVRLTRGELAEDPTSVTAHYILTFVQNFSGRARIFAIVYLGVHGLIKMLIVIGLFKRKIWVYPISIVIFGIFSGYEVYRFFFDHSLWILVLAAFDLFVIWLVWKEYTIIEGTRRLAR